MQKWKRDPRFMRVSKPSTTSNLTPSRRALVRHCKREVRRRRQVRPVQQCARARIRAVHGHHAATAKRVDTEKVNAGLVKLASFSRWYAAKRSDRGQRACTGV